MENEVDMIGANLPEELIPEIPFEIQVEMLLAQCHGQFLNGAIHWSVCDFNRPLKWFIVATDVFVELPLPKFDDYDVVEVKVRIFYGCLALCCGYNTYKDMWVMKQYGVGKSWIKVVCIPYFLGTTNLAQLLFLGDGKILIHYGRILSIQEIHSPISLLILMILN
ncbi:hypothetical protein ACS0TY_003074 [Phlomoides rotata]